MLKNTIHAIIILFLLIGAIPQASCQEKKKQKGFFAKLKEEMMPTGQIKKSNVEQYFNELSTLGAKDTAKQRIINDTTIHVAFYTKLSQYDEKMGGFYITVSRYNLPEYSISSGNYKIFLTDLQNFRLLKMSNELIKEKFNTDMLKSNVDIDNMKKGGQSVSVKISIKFDTAFVNNKEVRLLVGSINKVEVTWYYNNDNFKRLLGQTCKPPKNALVPYYTNIEDTKLNKLLLEYPFYDKEEWPRVSITILDFPNIYRQQDFAETNKTFDAFYCYPPVTLKATIWYSKTKKTEIPPFTYFPADFYAYEKSGDWLNLWGATGFAVPVIRENSGYKRTAGPLPPKTPLPQTPESQSAFFKDYAGGIKMVKDLLSKLGYDGNKKEDNRVWFNIEEAKPKK